MNVKNYEGSESLLYLQVTRLASHHLMETGCEYHFLGSEAKDSILVTAIAVAKVTSMCQVLEPSSLQAMQQGLGGIFTLTELHYRKKKKKKHPNFRNKLL